MPAARSSVRQFSVHQGTLESMNRTDELSEPRSSGFRQIGAVGCAAGGAGHKQSFFVELLFLFRKVLGRIKGKAIGALRRASPEWNG
jgi:hypothetical protein